MDAPTPILEQIFTWINNLSLPALLLGALGLGRWMTKKQQEAQLAFGTVVTSIDNLKTNHLHHIQETLDGIKVGQDKFVEQMGENTRDIIAAQNSSKDAIVNAILATRK